MGVIAYLLRMNGIFEVEDFVGDDGRRLVIVSLESGLRKRSNHSTAFVVNVFANVHVVLLVLGWPKRIGNIRVNYVIFFEIFVSKKMTKPLRLTLTKTESESYKVFMNWAS